MTQGSEGTDNPERTGNPEPGWYPNPEAADQIRWWDGAEWTTHLAPNPAVAPAVGPPPPAPGDLVAARVERWKAGVIEADLSNPAPQARSDWFSEVVGSIRARFGHLFTLTLVFGLVPSCLQFVITYFGMRDLVVTTELHEDSWGVSGVTPGVWVGFGASVLITLVLGLLLWLAVSRQIQLHRVGNPEPWSASIRPALARLLPMVGLHLLLVVAASAGSIVVMVVVAALAVVPVTLIATVPLAVALGFYLIVRLSLSLTALAIGPQQTSSIVTSMQLTKGRFGFVFDRFMSMVLTALAAFLASTMVIGRVENSAPVMEGSTLPKELTAEMIFGTNPASLALSSFLGMFSNALVIVIAVASMVVLYGDLDGEVAHDLQPQEKDSLSTDADTLPV